MDIQLEAGYTRLYKDLQNIMDNLVTIFKRFEVFSKRKKSAKLEWVNSSISDQKNVGELIDKLFLEIGKINSSINKI